MKSPADRRVSIDISLYPLTEDYKSPILHFIRELRKLEAQEAEVVVVTNPLSTQVYGPFELIWTALGQLLPACFGESYHQVAVLKIVSVDVTE